MKIIAVNVALETVLYCLDGVQMLKVVDYDSEDDLRMDVGGKILYFGEQHKRKYNSFTPLQEHAKVWNIKAEGDVLTIGLVTALDEI